MLRKSIIEYCMKKIETAKFYADIEKYEDIIEEKMSGYFTEQGLEKCNELLRQPFMEMVSHLRLCISYTDVI